MRFQRLKMFLVNIKDKQLCETIEKSRKKGRDDYTVRLMLNLIYGMKIFGHRKNLV